MTEPSLGGRGPDPEAIRRHAEAVKAGPTSTAHVTATARYEYHDYGPTPAEALETRRRRLVEAGTPHEVDGLTLRFEDRDDTHVEIRYTTPHRKENPDE